MGNTDSNCNFQLKIFAQSFFSPIFLKITFKRCALLESKQVDLFALLCVSVTTLSALLYVIKKKKRIFFFTPKRLTVREAKLQTEPNLDKL